MRTIDGGSSERTRFWWIPPAAFTALGFALRLFHLNHESLWDDEIFGLSTARLGWKAMHFSIVDDLIHPPLHYYVLHLWMAVLGFGAYQGRLLSVVAGTLAIPALYVVASYLADRRTAALAALLLSVSQLSIQYSQEARSYAFLLLLTICATYFYIRALRERDALLWWTFVGLAVTIELTHYYGCLALVSFFVFGVLQRKRRPIPKAWWLGGAAIAAACLAIWLGSGVLQHALTSSKAAGMKGKAFFDRWYAAFERINVFNNGRPQSLFGLGPWWTFAAGGALFSLPALFAFRAWFAKGDDSDRQREAILLLTVLATVPAVTVFALGHFIHYYEVRYLAFCAAPYYILVARGLASLRAPVLRAALAAAVVVYSGYSLRANFFVPYKEDFRGAIRYLAARAQPGDCYVGSPPNQDWLIEKAWAIYETGRPFPLRTLSSGSCPRVWLVSVTHGNFEDPVKLANQQRARLATDRAWVEGQKFFWTAVDFYQPASASLPSR
jgi:4-amino-4-deoxy-L-arabinose transferase-like glycosyltransferase